MGFDLRDHTADVAVAAEGDTVADVFSAVANGFVAASTETVPDTDDDRFSLSVESERLEALLFDYLDELIYQRDVRNVLPVDNRVDTLTELEQGNRWQLEASARAIPLERVSAREIKAVTYSEMQLEESADGWEAYVVFDV